MDTRKYIIFDSSELDKINFNEVLETSADTLVRSVDGSKTFVKYISNEMPASIASLTTKEGPFDQIEMNVTLGNSDWTKQSHITGSI
jgi:hypothetical protein